MLFLNMWLLAGIASIAVPIVIHLLNRRSAKFVDWGAIQFLLDSLVNRRRRILLEEVLLLGSRCLLLALVATAMARPFVPSGAGAAWLVVLPILLLAVVTFGVSFALWQYRRLRFGLMLGALGLLLLGFGLIALEQRLSLRRFGGAGQRDVAIVIDASMSMSVATDGSTNLEKARTEAARLLDHAGRKTAFSVIVGGPVPKAVVPAPIRDRNLLLEAIETIETTGGAMNVPDALAEAALSLSKGSNPSKQIIVLSDGQAIGWDLNAPSRWKFITDTFKRLPTAPQVVFRRLTLPQTFRNLAVTAITPSRSVFGVDREVGINVSVMNTGTEAITPSEIKLLINDLELVDRTIGQVAPGMTETIRFKHRFTKQGSYLLTAATGVSDDLPGDDTLSVAHNVIGKLPVLLVDGNPSPRFLERAAAFALVALVPGARTMPQSQTASSSEYLVEPELIDAPLLSTVRDFSKYGAVILADVPTVPADTAQLLVDYVRRGGGLLIAPGARAMPEFYNAWTETGRRPVLPARIEKRIAIGRGEDPAKPSITTFSHPALKVVSDASQNDIGTVNVTDYWQLKESPSDERVTVGARLNNGDPLLVERRIGNGMVLLTAISLDTHGSNLATKHAFLPIMHELVCFLANPTGIRLNLEPARKMSVVLSGNLGLSGVAAAQANGFRGDYFRGIDLDQQGGRPQDPKNKPAATRLDDKIDFNPWTGDLMPDGMKAEQFSVRWTGRFKVPQSGQYTFHTFTDDGVRLYVNGKLLVDRWVMQMGENAGTVQLDAAAEHNLRFEYFQGPGGGAARLFWSGPGLSRQLMPSSVIKAGAQGRAEAGVVDTQTEAVGPGGLKLNASIGLAPEGVVAVLEGDVAPGEYRLAVPPGYQTTLAAVAGQDGTVPFTVTRQPEESTLTEMDDTAIAYVRRQVGLLVAKSVEDLLQVLSGKAFGEELWRPLAAAALALLLAEVLLTRWIASRRRTGESVKVDFEELGRPSKAFREQLDKVRAGA
jgi:hypothetical protein